VLDLKEGEIRQGLLHETFAFLIFEKGPYYNRKSTMGINSGLGQMTHSRDMLINSD
jgi:hypothetical protein